MDIAIALDALSTRESETLAQAHTLSEEPGYFGFKINHDYIESVSLKQAVMRVEEAVSKNRWLFADVKMFKGGRTMAETARVAADLNVRYLNLFALADKEIEPVIQAVRGSETKILALTVLSHFDEDYCQRHFRRSFPETVEHFAKVAMDRGCHGIILPGTMLDVVKDLPPHIIRCATGIRPTSYKDTRHEQVVTPAQAREKGADIAVVGTPIMNAKDIRVALRQVLAEAANPA